MEGREGQPEGREDGKIGRHYNIFSFKNSRWARFTPIWDSNHILTLVAQYITEYYLNTANDIWCTNSINESQWQYLGYCAHCLCMTGTILFWTCCPGTLHLLDLDVLQIFHLLWWLCCDLRVFLNQSVGSLHDF